MTTTVQGTEPRCPSRARWWPAVRREICAAGDILTKCDLDREHLVRCGYFTCGLLMWKIDLRQLDAEEIASMVAGERDA